MTPRFPTQALCASFLFAAALSVGCSGGEERDPRGVGSSTGSGSSSGTGSVAGVGGSTSGTGGNLDVGDGGTGSGGAPEDCGHTLPVIFRDFKGATEDGGHPDFEMEGNMGQNETGCTIVMPQLGSDQKPVFQASIGGGKRVLDGNLFKECVPWDWTPMGVVKDAASFDQWYRTDTSATPINMEIEAELELVDGVYDSTAFFPIDDAGFGLTPNQQHNFSFTTESHVKFTPKPGDKFTFRGDDDLWIFVNGKLAVDLGGMHMPLEATFDFDAQKEALGLTAGVQYNMDIFHAERHTSSSNFRIQTNITCFVPGDIIK